MDPATPPTPPQFQWITQLGEFGWVLLAMAGGIARYLDSYLRSGQAPKWGLALTHATVSGFSGYMVAMIAIRIQPDWALVAAGVGGYLGTQGLDFASHVLKRRLGANDEDIRREEDKSHEAH